MCTSKLPSSIFVISNMYGLPQCSRVFAMAAIYVSFCFCRLFKSFADVQMQLQCLWHPVFVNTVFCDVLEESAGEYNSE